MVPSWNENTHIRCFGNVLITSRYPPDRQTIYLDVARPRGLIVIEKASKEEGRLSDQVREWIKENLELRAELPGLELLNDGTVVGGSVDDDGQDVLLHQQSLKSKHPGIIVGPDSPPTLSFTSGSEGRPKGVLGYAHFEINTFYLVVNLGNRPSISALFIFDSNLQSRTRPPPLFFCTPLEVHSFCFRR